MLVRRKPRPGVWRLWNRISLPWNIEHQLAQWLLNSYASSLFGLLNGLAQIVSIDGRCTLSNRADIPPFSRSLRRRARAVWSEREAKFRSFSRSIASCLCSKRRPRFEKGKVKS